MNRADLQSWLDRYVEAWQANERAPIEALFTDDATYRFRPYESYPAAHGIEEIVDAWLGDSRDEPGTWQAEYSVFAVDGDRGVATGYSRYLATENAPEKTYRNVFLLEFAADGRCRSFMELYMAEEGD